MTLIQGQNLGMCTFDCMVLERGFIIADQGLNLLTGLFNPGPLSWETRLLLIAHSALGDSWTFASKVARFK